MNELGKVIDNRPIRIGFIGCGQISEKHFIALEQHNNNFEVVAVCDIDKARSNIAASRMNATPYVDIDQMLQKEQLDIVTIATPNGLHPDHIRKVASYNMHIITDKPIACDYAEGQKAVDYCKQKDVQLFVVHQVRFNDSIQLVKKAIEQGRFGKIYLITSNVFWTRGQDYYDQVPWRGTKNMDGGAFLTQASHHIDLMQWFIQSKPKMVYANLKTLARKIETEDTGITNFEWQNGTMGNLNVTMLTYPKNFEGSITILGENGTARISGGGMNHIEHWQFNTQRSEDEQILNQNYPSISSYQPGHARYYENVLHNLQGKEPPMVNGNEGLKSLQLLQAIYDSSNQKAPIYF